MAVDLALLEAVGHGKAPPTLRVYAWDPPCLSLGHAQPVEDIDLAALTSAGWNWVRRPTGGRAILHTDELTYAAAAPGGHPLMNGGVLASYRRLSRGLVAALKLLGVAAEIEPNADKPAGLNHNPVCFEVPSAYEIKVSGRKLIGSAQVRRQAGVLQHGTLPLAGDLGRICRALRFAEPAEAERAAARVRQRAATLEQALGSAVPWHTAAEALKSGFEAALDIKLVAGDLSVDEQRRAAALARHLQARPGEPVGRGTSVAG
jgi:lipoate-protein ligase A